MTDSYRIAVVRSLIASLAAMCLIGPSPLSAKDAAEQLFELHIRPLLVAKCIKCHGEQKQEGKLRLDSRASLLQGGETGPAITPGSPADSLLLEAIRYESLEMPPNGQLSPNEVRQVELWIKSGAVWPESDLRLREESIAITEDDRNWWAFRPLVQPSVPETPGDSWSLGPIDRFIHARLTERELEPAPRASKDKLIRRLYFDLLGVPPTPVEVEAFTQNEDPQAWEQLVDSLLEDQRYGEHWARFWLDLVRYAESDGWNQDAYRPAIWRYRDYLIRAFNEDTPYPEFVRQQLAGDEVDEDNPDHLVATGFLRLGIYEYNQRDARGHWNDIMNEMTDVVSDVFLGLGFACARCHDHKFDPLPQVDYFKLRAFLEPVVWRDDLQAATKQQQAQFKAQQKIWEEASADVRLKIDELLQPYYDRKWKSTVDKFPLDIQTCFNTPVSERTSWQHQMAYLVSRQFEEEGGGPLKNISKEDKAIYEALQKELSAFDELKPDPLPEVMAVTDFEGAPSDTLIPDRESLGAILPGFPAVLSETADSIEFPSVMGSSGRRSALAAWIGSERNPLTPRVIVNRIWQQHFGRGICSTSSDFGRLGQQPTHPELLDWLAVTFIDDGWSIKKLHKRILMSSTWQQSAEHPDAATQQELDPHDAFFWRAPIRRLQAEQLRDAMLTISGELDSKVGGPSVTAKVPRRGIYVRRLRNTPDEFLGAFDTANGLKSVSERNSTTTAVQALLMINGEYTLARAAKLAERLGKTQQSMSEQLSTAFQLAWGRVPHAPELEAALSFVEGRKSEEAIVDFCHVLLNSNEFLYLD